MQLTFFRASTREKKIFFSALLLVFAAGVFVSSAGVVQAESNDCNAWNWSNWPQDIREADGTSLDRGVGSSPFNINEGDGTASITVKNFSATSTCTYNLHLQAFRIFTTSEAYGEFTKWQEVFDEHSQTIGPGETKTFTVDLPPDGCATQIDLIEGPADIAVDYWPDYGGDPNPPDPNKTCDNGLAPVGGLCPSANPIVSNRMSPYSPLPKSNNGTPLDWVFYRDNNRCTKLTVDKQVVNDNGGTRVRTSFFPMDLSWGGGLNFTVPSSNRTVTIPQGQYTLTEGNPDPVGYMTSCVGDPTSSTCDSATAPCSFTIGNPVDRNGDNKVDPFTCTITNDDYPPPLECTASPITANVGQPVTFTATNWDPAWQWQIPGGTPSSGTTNPISNVTFSTGGVKTANIRLATGTLASCDVTINAPFDYSLTNGGNKSVVTGQSVTNLITVTKTDGTAAPVSLSASGVPTGATASFVPVSCTPNSGTPPKCTSTMNINSGTAALGTYNVTVTGTSGGTTRTTQFNLTITSATPPTCSPNPASVTIGQTTSISASGGSGGTEPYYTWNTGGGTACGAGTPCLTSWPTVGTKTVTVTRNGVNGTCPVNVTAAQTYTLTVSTTGSGTVRSNPLGIDCGSDCSENYASGISVTLIATPNIGYSFAGWGGACSGAGSCVVTMDAAKSVTATFNALPPTTGVIEVRPNVLTTWEIRSGGVPIVENTPIGDTDYERPGDTYTFVPLVSGCVVDKVSQQLIPPGRIKFNVTCPTETADVNLFVGGAGGKNAELLKPGGQVPLNWNTTDVEIDSCIAEDSNNSVWVGSKPEMGNGLYSSNDPVKLGKTILKLSCNPNGGGIPVSDTVRIDVVATQCSDGIDNEDPEDSKIDYLADPGCSDSGDDDEFNEVPPPPQVTECNDGLDNDGDKKIDFEAPTPPPGGVTIAPDPGCVSEQDTSEFDDPGTKEI